MIPIQLHGKLRKRTKLYQLWLGTFQGNYHERSVFFSRKVGEVYEERCRPSLIPKGGLEIVLKVYIRIEDEKRRYFERTITKLSRSRRTGVI